MGPSGEWERSLGAVFGRLHSPISTLVSVMEHRLAFDDLPEQIEFHEKLRRQLDHGRKKLHNALARAAKIPVPGEIPKFTEEDRVQEIREALKKRDEVRVEAKSTETVTVRLVETPTIFFFDLQPKCYAKGTECARRMDALSDAYKEGKMKRGSEDWRRYAHTQTPSVHYYPERFQTDPILQEDKECSASDWILYDDLNEAMETWQREHGVDVQDEAPAAGEMIDEFQKAVQTTCRILASNTFSKEQIKFSHNHLPSRKMSYKLEYLWTLSSKHGPVNTICLNKYNPKILGVGYGEREGPGAALVWHVKNPECPERRLVTGRAVTSLQFSAGQPRLLAAVIRDGSVLVANIAAQPPLVTHVNVDEQPPFPEPLWSACWFYYSDGVCEAERLLTVGQGGELMLWDPIAGKPPKKVAELKLMVSPDPELRLRCQELLGEEAKTTEPASHFMQVPYIGLSIAPCPLDHTVVYVTTDLGAILKVNVCRSVEGLGWSRLPAGHKLPVLGLQHSPFLPKVFLTYSSDGNVAIWVHGFHQPLLNLSTSDISLYGLECAEWSPSHSSVLVSLSREEVCIWDIGRRTDRPLSKMSGTGYTSLAFSHQGTNLMIGCMNGDVLFYRLSEMPHRPYMQKDHLEKALRKALENKPDLLKGFNTYVKS